MIDFQHSKKKKLEKRIGKIQIYFCSEIVSVLGCKMGQIVEMPRGDLEKVLPREDLKPRDVPKTNPRAQLYYLASIE